MRHGRFLLCVVSCRLPGVLPSRRHSSIEGTVTDPSGAACGWAAAVTATSVTTGAVHRSQDHRCRLFCAPFAPGRRIYLTVTATGFEALTQSHVIVDALATFGVNPKLQIGAAKTKRVTVQDQPTILKTDDVALGSFRR